MIHDPIDSILTINAEPLQLRKSSQFLMPVKLTDHKVKEDYNIYPVCTLDKNKIYNGYNSLTSWIIKQRNVVIDGYEGIIWKEIKSTLQNQITRSGLKVNFIETENFFKQQSEIDELVRPFLGEADAIWGTKCTLELNDFYWSEKLSAQIPDTNYDINIVLGNGATLTNWDAPVIYIDLPKNELQFRMRAGSVTNLGCNQSTEPYVMYKRFYFVDWILCNKHKNEILNKIDIIADGQWNFDINWMFKTDLIEGLNKLSSSIIRVRPWFEPGVWGGQWIKKHIAGINTDVVNYAWSFELIVPENGLVFESSGYLLEVSFDFLMFSNSAQVLGKHAQQFGDEFPIRFDFLDTYGGGNLSIQCHPKLKYIQENFGEHITQDETYYILDSGNNAQVFLGFQENINPLQFKQALLSSQKEGIAINIKDFVQSHESKRHDLFLIPNGTIHSAGVDNMVLEISATPYIFTFKMYDWLRLDLDGKPRPINIDHAFKNLNFERKGERVQQELISKPSVIQEGNDWQLIHLPTHKEHFYDVHRIEFDTNIDVKTDNCCHIMMLVEGDSILVKTADGTQQMFAYAETFVIPAAAQSYNLTNLGNGRAKVIKAFLK